MLPEVGELVFSFVVGYMGALEFLYVVRHLYHWGFQHNTEMRDYKSEAASLRKLQDQLKTAIAEAKEREALGLKAMKDGVMYKDGFRIDEDRKKIEELKEKVKIQEKIAERQREIEAELERQRKIEEETKQQLKKAEEELRRMEEEKLREKRKAEEVKRKAEEEEKRKAQEAKRKAEDEKRRAEEEENKRKQRVEEEENMKKIVEAEKKKEAEQRRYEEEKENERKIVQAEKEREEKQRQVEMEAEKKKAEEQRHREEKIENERKLLQAEKEREEKQRQVEIEAEQKRHEEEKIRQEREENELKLLQAEKEREEQQRQQEIEDEKVVQKLLAEEREREKAEKEKSRQLLEAERQQQIKEENEAALERENTEKLIAAEKEAILRQREQEENEENVRNLLKVERELELKKQEMEEEAANLQRLIEAEKQMEERQRKIDEEALQELKNAQEEMELRQSYDLNAEVEEEAFIKKVVSQADQSVPQTVKTQYGQTVCESLKPKSLLFPGVSEESSSAEPVSSLQSSFSTQQSSEAVLPDLHFEEYERQAPDGGEDLPSLQYSDDYLRSLDGIKNKPLVREDGSGRRRAFKKRRSSGSSTSSRESRASREEELKMFTSLEEEEFENIRKGDSEYETIKYASEPNLKVGKQHRRHKRSPAKDAKRDPNDKGSLEMLDEEESNPWGEVKPENYKNTDFWKREKNLSIDEEQEEFDAKQRIQSPSTAAVNIPRMSSFEEATKSQHEEAISALKRQMSKDPEPIQEPDDEESETKNVSKVADARLSPGGRNSSPASASISPTALQSPQSKRANSLETEDNAARTTSPNSGLRRSPRVDEMREYEEKWKTEDRKARFEAGANPNIEIENASDEEPMSPEFLPEGISDFYDFNASINPSRSRSRSKTPALNRSVSLPERRTPSPLNSSHIPARSESRSPSPDPASYKFIVQRIIPNLDEDQPPQPPEHGLSDFYDFNTKLNREALDGLTIQRSHEVHRTSVDYVLEDLKNEKTNDGGAIAKKIEALKTTPTTPVYERSISDEMREVQKLKDEMISGSFKRSTYVGESMDFSDQFESLREEAKTFIRSRSCSRSPEYEDIKEMSARVLAKQQLQEKILEDITKSSENTEEFSNAITKNIVDLNRRASDTALIQKPEILFQIQDLIAETDENFNIIDCEPEEYHHFRRFSLGQELPIEQYPADCTYIEEIIVKPLVDLQSLTGNLEEIQDLGTLQKDNEIFREEVIEDAYESGSDDERQTVVEVDDEIDEDIWEYNEKPAEESHNEQSECEEADREMDRYADRNADDWREVEGAVGGVSDEDSFQIDQIYDEAIKNRKPSGILRDYDCILKEIQISDEDRLEEEENQLEKSSFSNGNFTRNLDPGMWSPRSRSSRGSSRDSSRSLIEYERRDHEMRYLADPTMSAINSTRLRSRYGIVPSTSLPTGFEDDTTDIDVNYVPKREYNWRKNFKLDDDLDENKKEIHHNQYLDDDSRKFSLGGESITLFSQSPEHLKKPNEDEQLNEEMEERPEEIEKSSKKKKNRRKSRKGSKGSLGGNEDDKESLPQQLNLLTVEGDYTKKKHRRESKKITEILPESADGQEATPYQQSEETESSQTKKKFKKHRKAKDEIIVLPKLDIVIPVPEKKAPPPSVAALRAALSAPPPAEKKSPQTPVTPKKLWETPSTAKTQSTKTETLPMPDSNSRSSVSPQPATIVQPISPSSSVSPQPSSVSVSKENGIKEVLQSKTHELTSTNLKESTNSPLPSVAFTLNTHNLTLKTEETVTTKTVVAETVKLELSETKSTSETKDLKLSESVNNTSQSSEVAQSENKVNASQSELPVLIPTSNPSASDSTQNPASKTDQNIKTPDSLKEVSDQKPNTINLDSDILIDGGLYPLF